MALSFLKMIKPAKPRPAEKDDPLAARMRIAGIHGNVRLDSEFGLVPVALLRRGDKLRTRDGTLVRIAAIEVCRFDHAMMESRPDLRPISISSGALGPGLPTAPVMLAPEQELGAKPAATATPMFQAASQLGRPGIERAPASETSYYTLRLEKPSAFLAEGLLMRA